MSQRIKGQEVEVTILKNGEPQENILFFRSLEVRIGTEILEEGYLGMTSNKFDTIYNGVRGSTEGHMDSPEAMNIVKTLVEKAQRRNANTKVNMKAVFNYPNGQRARLVLIDVEFGELPISFGSRKDYGMLRLDFASDKLQIVPG